MIDLSRLVEAPASSLPYVDPAFPNRPLVLHSARPRDYHIGTPVLFVHHGVRRNGRDYRDYWLDQVNEAGVLAIAIEFPEASFPEYLCYHFGNLQRARPIRGRNGRSASSKGYSTCCLRRASRPGNAMGCSATPQVGSSW